jgi:hypothetical protein
MLNPRMTAMKMVYEIGHLESISVFLTTRFRRREHEMIYWQRFRPASDLERYTDDQWGEVTITKYDTCFPVLQ